MLFIGIDPGKHGGIAAVDDRGAYMWAIKIPLSVEETVKVCQATYETDRCAVLERVGPSKAMGGFSAFPFGRMYGWLEAGLVAAGVPFCHTTPKSWMTVMGVLDPNAKGKLGKRDKNISKVEASVHFPNVSIKHWNAEALLLALYCRQLHLSKGRT